MSEQLSVDQAGQALVDPAAYADGRFEQACAVLRRRSPVHRVESPDFAPLIALTKHRDVALADREGALFHAAPRYRLCRAADEEAERAVARVLMAMDAPEHTGYRNLVSGWFHPRKLRTLEEGMRHLAKSAVDAMAERNVPYDFVTEVSMHLPLIVICSMLGIPESDRGMIQRVTQESFGSEDPEYQRSVDRADGIDPGLQFYEYFAGVVEDRLANPTDDLSSVLAHATIDGEPLGPLELFGFFGILATAGHDTTSSTMAGGLKALIDHPDQLERYRENPGLTATAVEEMIRWTSPVKSFVRTATASTQIRDVDIEEGEAVLLLYASANRDEELFDEPERFNVGRTPNHHLAFGSGAHFCLGAQLARMEIRAFFAELIPRLRHIELAGDPELVRTLLVGGLKHLPISADVV